MEIVGQGHLQFLDSTTRSIPDRFEEVEGDPDRAALAATWIAGQQQDSGLVKSWAEEQRNTAWLYDQALALLVLSRENKYAAARLAAAVADVQNLDGSWSDGFDAGTAVPLEDVGEWEGSVAWMTYALARHVALGGNRIHLDYAALGAEWLKTRQLRDGRVHDSTEANLDAWWAFHATGFHDEAEQLRRYLLDVAWREDQRRWNRGFEDPVIVLDTQTWGAPFARAVGEPGRALMALSFAEYALATTSFSGTIHGLDGAGPFGVWNQGTAQYVSAGGRGARLYLEELRRQQRADGAMPGSPDDFTGGDVWLTRWHGVAPTAWLYFAETESPFVVGAVD